MDIETGEPVDFGSSDDGVEFAYMETDLAAEAAVDESGVVVLRVTESPGRLFSPDEIEGQLSEEEFDERLQEQIGGPRVTRFLRTELPVGA